MHPFMGGFLTSILLLAGHQLLLTHGIVVVVTELCDQRADEFFVVNCENFCNDSSTCRWSTLQSSEERVNYCQCEEFNSIPMDTDVEYPCKAVPPPGADVHLCDAVCAQTNSSLDGSPLMSYYCQADQEEPLTCVCAPRMTPLGPLEDGDPIIMPRTKKDEGGEEEGCPADEESIGDALKTLFRSLWTILKELLRMIYGPITVLLQILKNVLVMLNIEHL